MTIGSLPDGMPNGKILQAGGGNVRLIILVAAILLQRLIDLLA